MTSEENSMTDQTENNGPADLADAEEISDQDGKMDPADLLDLFKHFDDMTMSKENLFIPVSVAVVPAVILNWGEIGTEAIIVAGLASLSLYGYLLLVIRRFGAIQNNLFALFRSHFSDFEEVFKYPGRLAVRPLRYYLFIILIIIWVFLFLIKAGIVNLV